MMPVLYSVNSTEDGEKIMYQATRIGTRRATARAWHAAQSRLSTCSKSARVTTMQARGFPHQAWPARPSQSPATLAARTVSTGAGNSLAEASRLDPGIAPEVLEGHDNAARGRAEPRNSRRQPPQGSGLASADVGWLDSLGDGDKRWVWQGGA